MTWVVKGVVVALAALVLFNAQCLATCAVQPCHPSVPTPSSHGDESNHCHQKPGGNDTKDKLPTCSHESVTSDGAKNTPIDQSPLIFAVECLRHDTLSLGGVREHITSELLLLPSVTIVSKTVLRI